MNESSAIQLCLKYRDPRGFEFLVEKYRREAMFHARMFLGNDEDAADACQESFARAFAAIPRLKSLDQFYPWFYRILKNCCLNMISKRGSRRKYEKYQSRHPERTVNHETPIFLLEKSEEKKQVWQVLEMLQPEFREILIMKYIQGLCYNEIAEKVGIPRGTVMSRLYYARKAFKDRYLEIETSEVEKEVEA